jgi:HK97 family phage prohead protease|nr:MAG TPA: major capsid protein [Caudoviricetes sp.]
MDTKKSNYLDCDFKGWATKFGILCADGRIIKHGAFDDIDGAKIPLVYNHNHDVISDVLGHAYMECREEGVYAYGYFNDTDQGQIAKEAVQHGDMDSLSIWANHLKQVGPYVEHGEIKEVSLVLAGANPGAFIEDVTLTHGEVPNVSDYEANIYSGEQLEIMHSSDNNPDIKTLQGIIGQISAMLENSNKNIVAHAAKDEPVVKKDKTKDTETVKEVLDSMSGIQRQVTYALVQDALNSSSKKDDALTNSDNKEDKTMPTIKHNIFEKNAECDTLVHQDMEEYNDAIRDGKRYGSLKESFLSHGITNVEYLFPDSKTLNTPPDFIARDQGWVTEVMNGVHHTPFSRIKSTFADLREDEARARGYIKGKLKKEEVFSLLKRTTTPQTIYKKQKIDRDDVVDITEFDVVVWLKTEMRMMLNEEIARAVLVGDGRLTSSDDHIKEDNIRPIWKDADLYTIKYSISITKESTAAEKATAFIEGCVRARINYKGSGNPKLFAPESIITECLLLKDKNGRIIYDNIDKLATACRVSKIVSVPVMEGLTRVDKTDTLALQGIIVNLQDYNIGADKGGAVNMFDDFDIDYNAQKYLIETRISGALIKPFSAIAIETKIPTADLSKTTSGSVNGD